MTRPLDYFPVGDRYALPGPLYRLGDPGAGTLRIDIDEERDEFVAAKQGSRGLWASDALKAQLKPAVTQWLARVIREDQPALRAVATLDGTIAGIQEDVVVMHRDETAPAVRAIAAYVNVASPSGWCPPCIVGKSFLSIHHPVPNCDEFSGSGRIAGAEALFAGNERVRFVWTLTPDRALDRRHCHRDAATGEAHASASFSWHDATEAWLRVERQTICPLDARTSVFLIRIYRYALQSLDAEARSRIRACLNGMPEAVRRYKGLTIDFDRIPALA